MAERLRRVTQALACPLVGSKSSHGRMPAWVQVPLLSILFSHFDTTCTDHNKAATIVGWLLSGSIYCPPQRLLRSYYRYPPFLNEKSRDSSTLDKYLGEKKQAYQLCIWQTLSLGLDDHLPQLLLPPCVPSSLSRPFGFTIASTSRSEAEQSAVSFHLSSFNLVRSTAYR